MDSLSHFKSIEDLVKTLNKEHQLLSDMFDKRKLLTYKYDWALEIVGQNEGRIAKLIDFGVLTEKDNAIEIDSDYLSFFEEVLNVNEEISVLSVQECINTIKENIRYYLTEDNETRKNEYKDKVRQILRKTGHRTLTNVVDLKRKMDDTYKQEPNYKIKIDRLKNLDEKGKSIREMIRECENLMDTEPAFFKMSADPNMANACSKVRYDFVEAYHALLEIDRQIISYINQIEIQSQLCKKIRRLKYLQDQFTIKEDTNITAILDSVNPIWMENNSINRNNTYSKIRFSIEILRDNDLMYDLLRKIGKKNAVKQALRTDAEPLSDEDLNEHIADLDLVNLEEIWNAFSASSYSLFDFVKNYDYKKEKTIEDLATIFCQLVINHSEDCKITEDYATFENLESPIVYAR